MIYLQSFRFPGQTEEEDFFFGSMKAKRTCYSTVYPFGLFRYRQLPEFFFDDITVFCGNNGSGKSTLLNVIAEKLGLERGAPFNRSDFFPDYVELCDYSLEKAVPKGSRIITSDGVFEKVLDIRRINDGIDDKRADLIQEYISERGSEEPNQLKGLADYERWRRISEMRNKNKTQSSFLRSNLVRNIQERSNGESALSHFVDAIGEERLYLLDEPENSLSPQNQLLLKQFIEESVRHDGCQFIISTHSPFLLSLNGASVYDIDETPPVCRDWTTLECVKTYFDFFEEQSHRFRS